MVVGNEKVNRPARSSRKLTCANVTIALVGALTTCLLFVWMGADLCTYAMNSHNLEAVVKTRNSFVGTGYVLFPDILDKYTQDTCTILGYEGTIIHSEVVNGTCESSSHVEITAFDRASLVIEKSLVPVTNVDNDGTVADGSVRLDNITESNVTIGRWSCEGNYDCPTHCNSCLNRCKLDVRERFMFLNATVVAQEGGWRRTFNVTVPLFWAIGSGGGNLPDAMACDYIMHSDGTLSELYVNPTGTREFIWYSVTLSQIIATVVIYTIAASLVIYCCCR